MSDDSTQVPLTFERDAPADPYWRVSLGNAVAAIHTDDAYIRVFGVREADCDRIVAEEMTGAHVELARADR